MAFIGGEGQGFDDDYSDWDNILDQLNQDFEQTNVQLNYGGAVGQELMINRVKVHFPYNAYKSQKQLMAKIIEGAHGVKNCLLESPTGTGKTAAILCALLGWQDYCGAKKLTQRDFAKIATEQAKSCTCGFMTNPENLRGPIVIVEEKTPSLSKKYSVRANIAVPDANFCSTQEICALGGPSPSKSIKIEIEAEVREKIITISKAKDDLCRYCVMKSFSKNNVPTIFYATRTHSQIKQVIDQLKNTPYKSVRMSILSSRQIGCINGKVHEALDETEESQESLDEENKDNKSNKKKTKKQLGTEKKQNLDEACRILRRGFFYNMALDKSGNPKAKHKKTVCEYFHLQNDLIKAAVGISSKGAWDIEDMIKFGQDNCICPYYTGQALATEIAGARIIFCPYNYLMCPEIRNSVGVNLTGNIVVFDEAHNIESISCDVASCSIDSERLDITVRQTLDKFLTFPTSKDKEMDKVKAIEYFAHLFQKLSTWMKKNAPKPNIESIYGTPTRSNDPPHKFFKGKEILEALDFIGLSKEEQSRNWDMYNVLTSKKESSEEGGKEKTTKITNNQNDNPQGIDNNPNISQTSNSAKEGEDFKVPVIVTRFISEILRSLEFLHQEDNLEHYRIILVNKGKMRQQSKEKQPVLFSSLGLLTSTQQQKQQQEDKEQKNDISGYNILLDIACMNPGIAFKAIRDNAHSIIVTSGTLSPMDSFSAELDTSFPVQLKAQHVIEEYQTLTGAIKYGSISHPLKELKLNKTGQNDVSTMDEIGYTILQICQTVPFGVLVFLPSYGFMTALRYRWTEYPLKNPLLKRLGDVKHIFYEEQVDKAKFENEMQQYKKLIDAPKSNQTQTGCILFAIFRGKVSEGINFSDNQARVVITLGIPYSNVGSHSVVCKMSYNDEIRRKPDCGHHLTGHQWYNIQAFRAMNQAFGRCIRHKNDWGAIILLESRFVSKYNQEQLSGWVTKNNLTVYEKFNNLMPHLENFVQQGLEFKFQSSQVDLSPKPSNSGTCRNSTPLKNPCRRLEFNESEKFEDENDQLQTQILNTDNMDLDSSSYSLDESDCVELPNKNRQKVAEMCTQIITRASSPSSSDDMDVSYHSSD